MDSTRWTAAENARGRADDTPRRHRIAVLALPGVPPFELGIPSRVFGSAQDAGGRPLYDVTVCTADGAPVPSDAGFTVQPAAGPEALAAADTVIFPPTHAMPELGRGGPLPDKIAAAIAGIRPGTRLVSICTGSYVLAAAGLLDGRPATTHWNLAPEFRRAYPGVRLDEDVLFVDDGDLLTSAGVAAGVDLCLHMIRRDHGAAAANRAARMCVVPPWRDGGQAQYIDRPVPEPTVAGTTATRAWALEHLGEPLTLARLAEHARMSLRSFTRRFRDEVGMTPVQWLTAQRLELAKQLLETTDLSIDLVAHRAGFGTANSLRAHMRTAFGVSPASYRRTFGATGPPQAGRHRTDMRTGSRAPAGPGACSPAGSSLGA
ncbi:helix-turn-helix domain-containing protein [Streptomyces griseofuscus]|uniref:Helix-turn-helix domain-containing protein n=1 Tax=Streptomyces griseofuscus TaxID=146922 RepID=A0A7H1PQN6_9ACTN|nr:helix-turn-helix domain-containing protein [Streptomyces griseofuscus]QNT90366.1 helix-turn-helix domain-containing protein [Streptomyces griseofuscus]QNT98080.1 helix-turn-helix domain-containing protein [Streptomyces griseofuscus]